MWGFFRELLGIGKEAIAARKEIKVAEHGLKVAHINAQAAAATRLAEAESGWEQMALQDAQSSWKDEFWTIVLALPLIASFLPWLQGYVAAGFASLEGVPVWYKWGLFAAWSLAFATKAGPSALKLWKGKG
ncbi:MAG: hypothetical protein KUG74_01050 [Rhodobacteraceae bacterium]|nr:hypothetical protein [Paracoccaceae bacterium]